MKMPTFADAFQVLLLQAADSGRGEVLFGASQARVREAVPPFIIGEEFPSVYLEHPLLGDPFLDITVLYDHLEAGMRVDSEAAGEHGAMFDWFAGAVKKESGVSFGFELDTKNEALPLAAVHFQPRASIDLVRPFCEAVGEPERADLYLNQVQRMPDGWPLSFFGMFRGRVDSPLRVCGYLDTEEKIACIEDPSRLKRAFDAIGFTAYDSAMVSQVTTLMGSAPITVDFQFDIYPDGQLSPVFAMDMQFEIKQPHVVREIFENGPGAQVMSLLEKWGVADDRWKAAVESAFACAIPVELDDGRSGRLAFVLMPQWAKARWVNGVLQPSKLYHLANAQLLNNKSGEDGLTPGAY